MFVEAHLYLKEWMSDSDTLQTVVGGLKVGSPKVKEIKAKDLMWDIVNGLIKFPEKKLTDKVTKREILSYVVQIFDSSGLLLPVTARGRMFLQKLWAKEIGWDEQLESELAVELMSLKQKLLECMTVNALCIVTIDIEAISHLSSDVSSVACGTVAYLVAGQEVKLLRANARVAPITKTTIPRVELTALLLSARLNKFIRDSYRNQLKPRENYLWSNSQVALIWMESDSRTLPTYGRNRVDEIRAPMTLET